MGSLLLEKKGAIYSLPQNLTVGGSEGPEIPGLCTGTSGHRCKAQNFRWSGNFRSKPPVQKSGPPPERKRKKDLAKYFLGRNFRTRGRNFRGPVLPANRSVLSASGKTENERNDNGHIFCIRTPFLMILDSLES